MQALCFVSALFVAGVSGHQDDHGIAPEGGRVVGPQPGRGHQVGPQPGRGHQVGPQPGDWDWSPHPVGPIRPNPEGPIRPIPEGPIRPNPDGHRVGPMARKSRDQPSDWEDTWDWDRAANLPEHVFDWERPDPFGTHPVGPHPVGPHPVGPHPVGPHPGNPRGCPRFGAPRVNSYCNRPGLECHYSQHRLPSSFQCSDDREWIRMPQRPDPVGNSCHKEGHNYKDGFKFINSQGCTEWSCEDGHIEEMDCPPPPSGCFKDGVTYANHFQPPPNADGCVEWQCEDGKIRYNPCPAHQDGCWRHGFFYHDGYTQYTDDARHCPIWECFNGHIEYLGACPDQKGCMKGGIEYADGFTKYRNGCAIWTCKHEQIFKLVPQGPKCEATCEYNGNQHPVGARVDNFRSRKFDCATALCQEADNGRPKWQCLLG